MPGSGLQRRFLEVPIVAAADLVPYHPNKLKIVAVNGSHRSPMLPEVPTLKELGYSGFDAREWVGLLMPANAPRALVDKWQPALARVLALPEVKERLAKLGMDVDPSTPEALHKLIGDELTTWGPVIKASGFKAD